MAWEIPGAPGGAGATPGSGCGMCGRLHKAKSAASQSPLSLLAPSDLPVLAAEQGLLLQVSEGPAGMLHPAVQFQTSMLLSFLTHPHPAVLTRDNHSCGFEHHTRRRCLLLNTSSLATITQHLKVGFSNWVTHP